MKKKLLAAIVSFAFVVATLCISPMIALADEGSTGQGTPLKASGITTPKGSIVIRDEFAMWGLTLNPEQTFLYDNGYTKNCKKSYEGKVTYDATTNTLTLNGASFSDTRALLLFIDNMGDLTISVTGKNTFCSLQLSNTNVTIVGDGTLNLDPPFDLSKFTGYENEKNMHVGFTGIGGESSKVNIGKDVTINFLNNESDSAIVLHFEESVPLESVFSYENEASETPRWKSQSDGVYVGEYDATDVVLHKFPAEKLYALEGLEEVDNYWICTESAEGIVYRPLVLDSDMWFEEYDVAYVNQYGNWTRITYVSDPYDPTLISATEEKLDGAVTFKPYDDFSEVPATLVKDGYATACVKTDTPASGEVYEKGGDKYKLLLSFNGQNDYYNASLDPIEPPAPGARLYRSYDMLKINTAGDRTYLTYAEPLGFQKGIDDEFSTDDVKAAAEKLGYKRVEHWQSYGFSHVLTNGKITFAPTKDTTFSIKECVITGIKGKTYTGKAIKLSITVKHNGTKLVENKDYKVAYKNNKNAGTATVTLTGLGDCTGSVTKQFTIARAANSITKVTSSKAIAYSKLKKKNQAFNIAATAKEKATKTFALSSAPKAAKKHISVSKAGKVTVKKGLKKNTYKIKVKITAAQTKNYKKTTVAKTIAITVK